MRRSPAAARIRSQSALSGRAGRLRWVHVMPPPPTGRGGPDPARAAAAPAPPMRTAAPTVEISLHARTGSNCGTPTAVSRAGRSITIRRGPAAVANFSGPAAVAESGRRARFRSVWANARGGSSPLSRIDAMRPERGARSFQHSWKKSRTRPRHTPGRRHTRGPGHTPAPLPAYSQPRSSATRTASPRLRASSFCITEDRWLRTVPGDRYSAFARSATVA
jgi:hypothetical protein